MEGIHTQQEILTQPDAWRDAHNTVIDGTPALTQLWKNGGYDSIIVTGCGSTHYLALTAAYLLQTHTRTPARAFPASELLLHPEAVYFGARPLLVAISRSGTTTETLQAVEQFKATKNGDVLVISCYGDNPLNRLATVNLVAEAGQEISVAQTRSFSAMLVMAQGTARVFSGAAPTSVFSEARDPLIKQLSEAALAYANPEKYERVFYLGSGELYGLACEAMLKMKEMSLTDAEAFHPLEFRHGPKSMVDQATLIVGLVHEQAHEAEWLVLEEMRGLGAAVITVGAHANADIRVQHEQSPLPLVLMMPFLQWLAFHRSIQKGLNPDTPRHLDSVVLL